MTTRARHWKQHWDPSADFVFLRRLRMDGGSVPNFVLPGDPVTDEMRERMGLARLRRWWDARAIGLAEFDPTTRSRKPESTETPAAGIAHTGRGWYTVTFADGETKRVRGESQAREELAMRVNARAIRAGLEQ